MKTIFLFFILYINLFPQNYEITKEPSQSVQFNHNENISKDSWFYTNSASLLGSIITAVGFILAIYQLRRNSKALQGDFALKLDDKMAQNRQVYKHLFKGELFYDNIPKEHEEEIEYYLTFFDTIALLVKNKQIKLEQINSLYGYRLICAMHNLNVQDILKKRIKSWQGIICLYKMVLNLRKQNGEEIDRPENEFQIQ